jgi:hypothetical protein
MINGTVRPSGLRSPEADPILNIPHCSATGNPPQFHGSTSPFHLFQILQIHRLLEFANATPMIR